MTEDEMVGWHPRLNGMSLSKLQEMVKDREAWCKESDTTEQLSSVHTYLQRRNKNSQKMHENMLIIIKHQRHANQNHTGSPIVG